MQAHRQAEMQETKHETRTEPHPSSINREDSTGFGGTVAVDGVGILKVVITITGALKSICLLFWDEIAHLKARGRDCQRQHLGVSIL